MSSIITKFGNLSANNVTATNLIGNGSQITSINRANSIAAGTANAIVINDGDGKMNNEIYLSRVRGGFGRNVSTLFVSGGTTGYLKYDKDIDDFTLNNSITPIGNVKQIPFYNASTGELTTGTSFLTVETNDLQINPISDIRLLKRMCLDSSKSNLIELVSKTQTTSNTTTQLASIYTVNNTTIFLKFYVVGIHTSNNKLYAAEFNTVCKNIAGTITNFSILSPGVFADDIFASTDVSVTNNSTNILINVINPSNNTINWRVKYETVVVDNS